MNCAEASETLPLHVAGQLADDGALRAHLAECDGCARRAELHGRVWELAGLAVEEPLPAGPVRAVRQEIARLRPRGRGVALRAAAVAASALLGWLALAPRTGTLPMLCAPDDAPSAYVEPAFGDLTVEEGQKGPLSLRAHRVSVAIDDWVARTEVEEVFFNDSDRRLEGTFQFPLPADASLSRFAMEVNGTLVEGELVERVRAREVYEGIVRRMQDPALLEWMPGNIFKARIFPIEPRSVKRIVLAYTQAPRTWNGALRYVYPLVSEKTKACPPEELSVRAEMRFSREIRRLECPAHRVDEARPDARSARVELRVRNARPAADFQLRVELEADEVEVASHRPPGEDGFLGIAIAPRGAHEGGPAGDHVFVVDRSARMGEKDLDVARRVVDRMLDRLGPKDRAAIVAHHVEAEATALEAATPERRRAWRDHLWGLRSGGASDVVSALRAAAAVAPAGATIVYVGKGVVTWGEEDLAQAGVEGRSLRAVLVGSGTNEEGFARIAGDGVRAIVPGGDVEAQILAVARTVGSRPVRDLRVEFEGVEVREQVPTRLPAVYPGERVHLFARYRQSGRVTVVVRGSGFERRVEAELAAGPTERGALPRLWAQRALSGHVEDCRRRGEPRELVERIVAMSRQYQVMSPYTSFLVLESEEAYKQFQIDRAKRREEEAKREEDQKKRLGAAGTNLEESARRIAEEAKGGRTFRVEAEQSTIEVSKHLRDGERYFNARMFDEAAREFASAGSKISNGPPELGAMRELLPRVKDAETRALNARVLEERRVEEEKKRVAEAEASGHEVAFKREVVRKMARLLELSYMAFDQRRYDRCMKLCDEVLLIDPHYSVAKELKEDADKTRHKEEYHNVLARKVEQWKRLTDDDERAEIPWSKTVRFPSREEWAEISRRLTVGTGAGFSSQESARLGPDALALSLRDRLGRTELHDFRDILAKLPDSSGPRVELVSPSRGGGGPLTGATFTPDEERQRLELNAAVQADVLQFPDRETWKELISKRKPKGIAELEDDVKPEDQEILEKLRSTRITIDMQNAPLTAVVDYIREISGLNMHITGVDNADSEMINFKISDIAMEGALRVLLGSRRLAYIVRDGVVLITSQDQIRKQVKLELYDVQDLTYGMKDFPGVDISLAQDGRPGSFLVPEVAGPPAFEEDPDILAINRKLETMKIDLAFENTKFDDILAYIRDFSGLNIVVDAANSSAVEPNRTITFKVKDLVLKEVLARLFGPLGLGCVVTPEKVLLVTSKIMTGEDLAALLKRWTGAEGTSIQFQNGLLIVRAGPEMHRQVRRFLRLLRGGAPDEEDRMEEIRRKIREESRITNHESRVGQPLQPGDPKARRPSGR